MKNARVIVWIAFVCFGLFIASISSFIGTASAKPKMPSLPRISSQPSLPFTNAFAAGHSTQPLQSLKAGAPDSEKK